MILLFCPKCGSILMPKKEGKSRVMACSCGYTAEGESGKIHDKPRKKEEIAVVEKEEEQVMPLTEAECPKCGHKQAYVWTVQTRAGDEPETKFLKCEKCRHTWRDYS